MRNHYEEKTRQTLSTCLRRGPHDLESKVLSTTWWSILPAALGTWPNTMCPTDWGNSRVLFIRRSLLLIYTPHHEGPAGVYIRYHPVRATQGISRVRSDLPPKHRATWGNKIATKIWLILGFIRWNVGLEIWVPFNSSLHRNEYTHQWITEHYYFM